MKKFFYYIFLFFSLIAVLFANELDEEFIDKKYNEIKTSDFCSIKEWNLEEKKLFVLAFILGWNWEVKEEAKLNKFNNKEFDKLFSQICSENGLLIKNLEHLVIKNDLKIFYYAKSFHPMPQKQS